MGILFSDINRIFGFLACLVTVGLLAGCPKHSSPVAKRSHVTLGIQLSPANALPMVAKDQEHFSKAGVDVELKGFAAGKFALQAFLGGSLDYAVCGEVPATLASLQGNQFRIVTQVVDHTKTEVRVVARRDSSATNPSEYFRSKRRRLATSFGGGPEFFTYTFLKKYHLGKEDVNVVPMQPQDMVAALKSGSVDAISIFDPIAYIAEQQLGSDSVTFSDPALYSELYVLVCKPQDAIQKRAEIDALLRGLVSAEDAIRKDPQAAEAIVAKYTKLEPAVVHGVWPTFAFAPALNNSLLEYMDAEAKWAREKGDVSASAPNPDFRSVIEAGPLRAVKKSAVGIP